MRMQSIQDSHPVYYTDDLLRRSNIKWWKYYWWIVNKTLTIATEGCIVHPYVIPVPPVSPVICRKSINKIEKTKVYRFYRLKVFIFVRTNLYSPTRRT